MKNLNINHEYMILLNFCFFEFFVSKLFLHSFCKSNSILDLANISEIFNN